MVCFATVIDNSMCYLLRESNEDLFFLRFSRVVLCCLFLGFFPPALFCVFLGSKKQNGKIRDCFGVCLLVFLMICFGVCLLVFLMIFLVSICFSLPTLNISFSLISFFIPGSIYFSFHLG